MSSARRGYVDGPFGQVHYRERGHRTQPPLLMLHQTPSSSAMYETLMACLEDQFWCVAPDTPGFGASDPAPAPNTATDYGRAIAAVIESLDLHPCAIFGHHSGAGLAVQLAVDHPDRVNALVLSGPPLVDEDLRQTLLQTSTDLPVQEDGGHLQAMWQRIRGKDPRAPLAISHRETLLALQIGSLYHQAYQAILGQPLAEQLPRVGCPALVLAGDRDPLRGAVEPCAALLPDAHTRVLDDANTYVCEQDAERLAAMIQEFLRHV